MVLKSKIIKTLFLTALCFLPISSYAANNSAEIKALSAPQFWAKVNNLNVDDEEKEYIICGQNVCRQKDSKNDQDDTWQRCIVKVTERKGAIKTIAKIYESVGAFEVYVGGVIAASGFGALMGAELAIGGASHIAFGAALDSGVGDVTIKRYKYQCRDNKAPIPEGWEEAPEGGFVQRVKQRTGGWLAKAKTKEESCYEASDENKYCILTKDKEGKDQKSTVVYNNKGTAFKGCEVLSVKLYNNRRCFFCSLFTISVKVANDMTAKSFNTFAAAFSALIAVGLAIWIAIQVLLQVSSVTKQDAAKFMSNLLKQCYKFVIAFLLLQNSSYIFEKAISPLILAGIDFGTIMIGEDNIKVDVHNMSDDSGQKMEKENPGVLSRASSIISNKGEEQYFSSNLYIQLDNFIARLQRKLSFMQSVGGSLLCIGNNAMRIFNGTKLSFGDGFKLFIEGILLAGFGFLMALAFAFYMVDAIVQIAVVGALMPFLIASWPFKLTSKYAQTGWSIFLNSVFLLMFSGLIINVGYNLVDGALKYSSEEGGYSTVYDGEEQKKDIAQTTAQQEVELGALYKIAQKINQQNEEGLAQVTDISSVEFLMLLFCCIFALKMINKIQDLAGKFASGALSPIAPEIATMGASAAKNFALKSTQSTREAMSERFENGVKNTVSFAVGAIFDPKGTKDKVVNKYNQVKNDYKQIKNNLSRKLRRNSGVQGNDMQRKNRIKGNNSGRLSEE